MFARTCGFDSRLAHQKNQTEKSGLFAFPRNENDRSPRPLAGGFCCVCKEKERENKIGGLIIGVPAGYALILPYK